MLNFRFIKSLLQSFGSVVQRQCTCPVCAGTATYLDAVDFNKSCEEIRGKRLSPSSTLVHYYLCDQCGFCFAPEFAGWSFSDFEQKIYNDGYEAVDPDYRLARPQGNAELIEQFFTAAKSHLHHLDYGGGSGLLSQLLGEKGWHSQTYDPFVDRNVHIDNLGQFDLISAFEVFEHVPDIDRLMEDLLRLCKPDGLIMFSTLLSDGNIRRGAKLDWWYASPRNGHISLFSGESLALRLAREGLHLVSFNNNLHMAFRQLPPWASHLIKAG